MNEILLYAKEKLSPLRFQHVLGVVETAKELAGKYYLDVFKAELAASVHDIYRELNEFELRQLAQDVGFSVLEGAPVTWHGPIAAARLFKDFSISDEEVQEAVAWHTLGHPDMGRLAQVIFVADAIEPGREFPMVHKLRIAANTNLNLAVAAVADATIYYLLKKNATITTSTVLLRNKMWGLVDERIQKDYNQSISELGQLR